MTHEVEVATPTATVAKRMRELREKRRMTAKQLAARMAQLGVKWDRSIVANLEIGRRSLVSVEELLALAYVLDVAPVHLLIPLGDEWYAVTPTQAVYSGRAREWIRGTHPLPSTDPRLYFAEVPAEEYVPPQPVSEEEQRQRREQRLARLRQLEEEGVGEITWTSPPEEDPGERPARTGRGRVSAAGDAAAGRKRSR